MAKSKKVKRVSRGEWDRFEKDLLRAPKPPRPPAGKSRAAVETVPQSEPESDDVLMRFAERSQLERRRGTPIKGNVIFLHGITGADLAVSENGGKTKGVWVSIPQMIFGGIRKLKLALDGKTEFKKGLSVIPTGVNKQFYARAIVALRAHWNVESFAYDWRKDIDDASDKLADFIEERFPGQPVHLVAHSMGGLVSRNFIKRHPQAWKSMRDPELSRGGRLIMLGTPNYGSYAIAQVMTGTDALLARLEKFDIKDNMAELLDVTNSFLGTYMLLPAHGKLSNATRALYQKSTWGKTPAVSQAHLDRTLAFYDSLDTNLTLDGERMVYVAGVNQTTISGVEIVTPGEFKYQFTRQGDGRVPHDLGLLHGVPTYYVDEVHGDLARNEQILRELDDLLETGKSAMATMPGAAVRGPVLTTAPPAGSYRSGADRAALDILEEMSSRTRAANTDKVLSEEDKQVAADALLKAALGARTDMTTRARQAKAAETEDDVPPGPRPKLTVRAEFGGIESVSTPLAVVGHYRGVKPVRAIGAIDRHLNKWISLAVERGMISGHLGETFIIPTARRGVKAQAVIIAGMGDYGKFSADSLRQIMSNVAQAAAALRIRQVSSVLVGAGEGNLSVEQALKCMLEGFAAGLSELKQSRPDDVGALQELRIVELNSERFIEIDQNLEKLSRSTLRREIDLRFKPATSAEKARARRAHAQWAKARFEKLAKGKASNASSKANEIRLTVEFDRERSEFRFSALTDGAVVPARKVEVTRVVAEETARLLAEAQSRREQRERGRVLFDYVFPRDLEYLFDNDAAVRMIVDPTTAAIPWEMACLPGARNQPKPRWLGTNRRLTRQFRTLLSQSVGVTALRGERLRALVIADPAAEPEWQLPGARAEGRRVANLLKGIDPDGGAVRAAGLDIDVESYIGSDEASPVDLIGKLVSGHYHIVHFAGHGNYSDNDPEKSGWVLSASHFVTAKDIFRSRSAPWLIMANACYSGSLRQSDPYPSLDAARRGAAIAEAFMDRGVRNYVGTGWTVDDDQAMRFALAFYKSVLANETLGEAVHVARDTIYGDMTGSTWGAYQFYGDPNDRVLPQPAKE
jgi:CHAT domain-containing protein/pimeloyl-ACP methyl ester carboxylesterase